MTEIFSQVEIWLLGLLGLNIIVFIHELGHFLVARSVGINVEVFSIGLGPKLWKKQFKTFEFAISLLPLGGYCKMQGESIHSAENPIQQGDMYYGHPWRRMITVFAGAGFNFIFAYILFVIINMLGTTQLQLSNTIFIPENRIEEAYPFQSGDTVLFINDTPINSYFDLRNYILENAEQTLTFTLERQGERVLIEKHIDLDKQTGRGTFPRYIYPDLPNIIQKIIPNSPAERAKLQVGDRIVTINENPIDNFYTLSAVLSQYSDTEAIQVDVLRNEHELISYEIVLDNGQLGIESTRQERVQGLSLIKALHAGSKMFINTLHTYWRGIKMIIQKEVSLQESTAGPVQTTAFIGQVAKESFQHGIYDILLLLGVFSLIIGFTNLLPIPVLDGGLIVLFVIESLRKGKPLPKKFLSIYQTIGIIFIMLLLYLAVHSDIRYLLTKPS
ncbi:RIP metalloprotease RseP [Entomospira entomophila]|uniref:Zinc metalloprotease n=1 Tax=Entomospira entomophila TaxID=2719988 RepID=A0A968G8S8_9SPIO|nr:RIP metalloprotease RseP [Entomospira entomophilus]NIZ39925.1 RIP metalloprotease RseP [Entomospira entomophilus]WDI35486.1 RIP metalloprotease RseP [Entomospira entomophilus]